MPTLFSQSCRDIAMNSGPLSIARQLIAQQSMRGGPNELGLAKLHEQWVQRIQNIARVHLGSHRYAQRLTAVFIQHRQHLVTASIAQFVVDKINGPDVVGMDWAQSNDGAVFVVKPPALLVAMGQLQPFFAP